MYTLTVISGLQNGTLIELEDCRFRLVVATTSILMDERESKTNHGSTSTLMETGYDYWEGGLKGAFYPAYNQMVCNMKCFSSQSHYLNYMAYTHVALNEV